MNRCKKINQLLKANAKKASAKLAPKSKNTYVSKADRAKMAASEPDVSALVEDTDRPSNDSLPTPVNT